MTLCQFSVPCFNPEGRRFTHSVQLGPRFLSAYLTGAR